MYSQKTLHAPLTIRLLSVCVCFLLLVLIIALTIFDIKYYNGEELVCQLFFFFLFFGKIRSNNYLGGK